MVFVLHFARVPVVVACHILNHCHKQLPASGCLACSGEQSPHSMVPLKMFESLLPSFSSLIANDVLLLQNLIAVSGYDKVGLNLQTF